MGVSWRGFTLNKAFGDKQYLACNAPPIKKPAICMAGSSVLKPDQGLLAVGNGQAACGFRVV